MDTEDESMMPAPAGKFHVAEEPMGRTIARALARVFVVLILLIGAIVGFCAFSYSRDMHIDLAHGVNEASYVRIGGIDQWIQIRGEDRNNPVLLWLNGGPGLSTMPNTYLMIPWESQFTVVMWDQRGEGRTFERSGESVASTMTIDRMTSDGIEVAEYLRVHLHKNKVILLGHSWGSILGVHMAHLRPELFAAYVGTGQVTNLAKQAEAAYPLLIARAYALGNNMAEQQLVSAGPPPYPEQGLKKWTWVRWANRLDPRPPQEASRSPAGALWWVAGQISTGPNPGADFSQPLMWTSIMKEDLPSLGLHFDVPIIFIQGTEDVLTVTALVKDYFDRIDAPSKQFVLLPGVGHQAVLRNRGGFLRELLMRVRPLAVAAREASADNLSVTRGR